ncbi:MAG: UDP-N-acetylglucosamine 1-carboxyvinyltransferase [Candidatus Wildermuthbacteria bacterium RIFCSPHIGHO2_12_FULL_45_9]|uniref:UDP-N-acetylglucosamine 1-carboxyvinyltransferase n=1 Tax=Candidatus Wildermuthbacteria bacterium RIFCSPHIGHO2_02_FULL_45_25 TaxID=1802450 RepID=A0A1G2QZL7_9BACT|nr:MAG: UDP-N-acetylglucosamine 1-carboxyvinyltransferase [Candidatus Wildermuthbacteria bacterium RIFCSPHIGHO2_01_FULL_45_20]OHA65271.1 MAG: UDP-N-acetylglucosamine 1-carboxyvinyltransferase [Candidatus Wildermuthbacteria bacterium RIFCSPHIGHO2_02_FULL_45_25]OHA71460.1 MAG: UDP-N-acetylglucosamine 1-carboxyvinyltransferase [Candidatus Wildermuthbacteria bacterium RIFCSPHIGHO2_12_FULL_45_9]
MERFVINGGKPLKGEIEVRGAKNAAFPILAATILTKEDCVIENLPLVEDVYRMIELLESMGTQVEWRGERVVSIHTRNLNPATINKRLVLRFRGAVLLFGPLLARFGVVNLPQPGGCMIGARPIDTHLDAFAQLGVKITPRKDGFKLVAPAHIQSQEVILNEFSVTATENILLYASACPEKIVLKIADQDYQVQELVKFLKKMGSRITIPQSHEFLIQGQQELTGASHQLMADPIEAGTFIAMAVGAKGDVLVKNVEYRFLELFLKKLRDFGAQLEIIPNKRGSADVHVSPTRALKIDKIQSLIYPGIHSDLQSVLGVLATQSRGSTLLHDPLYEGRLRYLEELNKMGAEIYFTDPHRAIINGPAKLYGTDLGTFDLRGGAALIMAALIAKGRSAINNIYQVDRGYEHIEERLQALGADIQRISD